MMHSQVKIVYIQSILAACTKNEFGADTLSACCRSPLIMGIRQATAASLDGVAATDVESSAVGKTLELFLASDASAVVEHTNT